MASLATRQLNKCLLIANGVQRTCAASAHHFPNAMEILKSYDHVVMPERRKLPVLLKVPIFNNMKPPYSQKKIIDLRGPELVHNQFLLKQYGIVALQGGQLKHGHIEMMRLTINRKLKLNCMFAIWRIDAPWKPRTKKGAGKRMGGGKGAINHYTTPVKAGRVILEVGGRVDYEIVRPILQDVVYKLPFKAKVTSYELMNEQKEEEERLAKENLNPWTFEYIVKNNMQCCHKWIKAYDHFWYGKYE